MGYLIGSLPDFKKILSSFWFKVPSATIAAVRAAYNPAADPQPQMAGMLPFLFFGPRDLFKRQTHSTTVSFGTDQIIRDKTWNGSAWVIGGSPRSQSYGASIITNMVAASPAQPFNPGFIGIDCTTPENILVFRFPYAQDTVGTAAWASAQINGETYPPTIYDYHNPSSTPPGPPPYDTVTNTHALQDLSSIVTVGPEMFTALPEFGAHALRNFGDGTNIPPEVGVRVTADQWHHIELAADFTTLVSVEGKSSAYSGSPPTGTFGTVNSTSKMYLAFDDINRTGQALSYFAASAAGGGGVNDVLTPIARTINGTIWDTSQYDPVTVTDGNNVSFTQSYNRAPGLPTYEFTPPDYQSLVVYLPGDISTAPNVKMAYLQVFTGVAPDTGTTGNRRPFVKSNGTPETDYSIADALFGVPVIRFKNGKDFKIGKNTGSGGNLGKTGTINPSSPGPSL